MELAHTDIAWPAWDRHVQTLHRHFADRPCLAWINPAQHDPFDADAAVAARKIRVPIAHPRFDLRYAPYLLRLDLSRSIDSDILARTVALAAQAWTLDSLQQMNGQPVCGWVEAPCTAHELAGYWARSCHVHHHAGLAKLLRFHDPAVREWLWHTLDQQQRITLLGPATALWSIARDEDMRVHREDRNAAHAAHTLLTLTASQWAEVDDYAIVHAAWLALCAQDDRWRDRLCGQPDWQRQVLDCLRHATTYGITAPQDRALFARHALEIGSDFHLHAALEPVWQQTRTGEFYGGTLEEVTGESAERLSIHLQTEA